MYISFKVSGDRWLRACPVEDLQSSEYDYVCRERYRGVSRDCCCHLNYPIAYHVLRITIIADTCVYVDFFIAATIFVGDFNSTSQTPIYMPPKICIMNIFHRFVRSQQSRREHCRVFTNFSKRYFTYRSS